MNDIRDRVMRIKEKEARKQRIAESHAEAAKALAENRCPKCGQGVRRNNALTGWVQCEGYGAPGFRAKDSVPCSWQGFTQ